MSGYKERIEQAQSYWAAYWRGEVPMINAIIPKPGVKATPKPPLGITEETDIDALCDQLLAWENTHDFLGGAIPFYCVYFFDIYSVMGSFLGGQVERSTTGNSVHMLPFVDDLENAELKFRHDAPLINRFKETVKYLKNRLRDKVLVTCDCFTGGNLDTLEAIRGSTKLLIDLYDNPEGVHHCLRQIQSANQHVVELFTEIFEYERYGSICRHGLYNRGKISVPQCDFAYMIDPEMFNQFALPYLKQEFDQLDGVCYHLDGVGNLPNWKVLCGQDNLHLIQWVPGEGNDKTDWSGLFKDIANAGKGLLFIASKPEEILSAIECYQTRWLYFMNVVASRQDVEKLLEEIAIP